ncbi:unnamed protein product [Arabis nemorensis]|uniref:Uncharacterized protein n=1 Tax=Arabis nemorensis TaxID=586526 RepID=A0A565AWS7_9BRAS|nr:unnamed protein product [Arabis nemorensis]
MNRRGGHLWRDHMLSLHSEHDRWGTYLARRSIEEEDLQFVDYTVAWERYRGFQSNIANYVHGVNDVGRRSRSRSVVDLNSEQARVDDDDDVDEIFTDEEEDDGMTIAQRSRSRKK